MNEQENTELEGGAPLGNGYLSEILKSIASSPSTEAAHIDHAARVAPSQPPPPSADIFSSLLSNPELLGKLPQLISSIKPMLDMLGMGTKSAPTLDVPAASSTARSEDDSTAIRKKSSEDHRAALLCAMKPYLSHDRQQAVDYILKLSRLGDLLKSL